MLSTSRFMIKKLKVFLAIGHIQEQGRRQGVVLNYEIAIKDEEVGALCLVK